MDIDTFGSKLAQAVEGAGGRCVREEALDEDTRFRMKCFIGETTLDLFDGIVTYLEISQHRGAATLTVYEPQRLGLSGMSDSIKLEFGDNDIIIMSDGSYETSIML